jgi:cytoskeleton protein RodZ
MSTPDATVTTELTAGQLLRQAREQRNLSVADVALQLNLRLALVQQIEADQLDSSILITFVRGYLRAYARLVKLPEKQVLHAFEQQNGGGDESAKPMRTFSNQAGRQATENRFMWLTYAIGFLLVLMLVLWWWQTASPGADNASQPPAAEASPGKALVADNSSDNVNSVNRVNSSDSSENSENAGSTVIAADNMAAGSTDAAAVADRQADFVASQPLPSVSSEPLAAEISAVQPDVITMNFQDNCWIDVLDADGNRIAYGTKEAGYQMTVSGKAPFVVTLGNPSVVQITLNNQPFDMSSLPAGRVAKFTLAEPD